MYKNFITSIIWAWLKMFTKHVRPWSQKMIKTKRTLYLIAYKSSEQIFSLCFCFFYYYFSLKKSPVVSADLLCTMKIWNDQFTFYFYWFDNESGFFFWKVTQLITMGDLNGREVFKKKNNNNNNMEWKSSFG